MQREWAKHSGGNDKVIGWPAHLFEQFLVVVRQQQPLETMVLLSAATQLNCQVHEAGSNVQGLPPTTDVKSVVTDAETAHTGASYVCSAVNASTLIALIVSEAHFIKSIGLVCVTCDDLHAMACWYVTRFKQL